MAGITHTPVVGTAEGSDSTKIRKSNWEADHNIADSTITLAMLAFDVATQVELNALSASLGSAAFTSAGAYEVPLTFSTGLTRIGNTITASGGGGSGTVTSVGLLGTANQVTVTGSSPITGSGSWTLSIPGSAQLSIAKLTNLTSNGLVTTSSGDGTLGITSTSGSGNVVLVTSATLVTPTLGVASATSLTTTVLKSATTVAIQTNGTTQTVIFGTDQSATFAGVITATSPVFTTPALGVATGTSLALTVGANASALTITGHSVTSTGTASLASFAGTLNGTGIVDVIRASLTVTATNASSKLLNLYAGASGTTSVFSVGMTGNVAVAGQLIAGGQTTVTGEIKSTLDMWVTSDAAGSGYYFGSVGDLALLRNAVRVASLTDGGTTNFGDLKLRNLLVQAGGQISMTSTGGAAVIGNATLVGGSVTVSTTAAVTGVKIFLQRKASGGTIGTALTYTISSGTSFTINSDNVLDTSTVDWWIAGAL